MSPNYQKLFDHMSKEHGLTLLEGEMIEIINIVRDLENQTQLPIGVREKVVINLKTSSGTYHKEVFSAPDFDAQDLQPFGENPYNQ